MRPTNRFFRLLAMLLALAMLASACGSDDQDAGGSDDGATDGSDGGTAAGDGTDEGDSGDEGTEAPAEGLTLTVALDEDFAPTTYDPLRFSLKQFAFHSLLYDSLFSTTSEGEIAPELVTAFETSEDGSQLVLTVRDDVTFDDGTPLDAEAIKANLDRRLEGGLQSYEIFGAGQEGEIAEVTVTGPFEVTIDWAFEGGLESGQDFLADNVGVIVSPKGAADATLMEAAPEGSGPYTLDQDASSRGATYVLRKKADHWNADEYAYDTIVLNVITDGQARANSVLSGEADLAIAIQAEQLNQLEASGALARVGGTMGSLSILDKTGERNPAFADPEVRKALSMAIDRQAIVDGLVPGGEPTVQYFPADAVGHDPTIDERYPYDPQGARDILEAAGFADGFEVTTTVLGDPSDLELAVQQMWAEELGVELTYTTASNTGELFASVNIDPIILAEWGLGLRPAGFVAGPVTSGFMNTQGAENERISAALGPALGGDPEALVELNNALIDEAWWFSIYETFSYVGYDPAAVADVPFGGISGIVVMADVEPAG